MALALMFCIFGVIYSDFWFSTPVACWIMLHELLSVLVDSMALLIPSPSAYVILLAVLGSLARRMIIFWF